MATIAPSKIPLEVKHRIERSVEWLLSKQRKEGYWGEESPWLTGVVIWSLAQSTKHFESKQLQSRINSAIDYSVVWLETCQVQGGWDIEVGTWDTAIIARALIAAGKQNSPVCQRALDYLEAHELNWFGKTRVAYGEGYPAQTLLALIEGGRDGFKYLGILSVLRQEQDPDEGGWEDHLCSPEIIEAICIAEGKQSEWKITNNGKETKGGMSRAIAWVEHTQSKHGDWGGYTWHTATTLRSYLLAAQNPNGSVISKALSWLLNQQHPTNGSWFHSVSLTAYAVLSLAYLLERQDTLMKITPPILGPESPPKPSRHIRIALPEGFWVHGVLALLCLVFLDLFLIERLQLLTPTIMQLISAEAGLASLIVGVISVSARFKTR